MQTEALLKAGVKEDNLYTDKKSGRNMKRLGLQQALLDARKGDILIVWKIDRLSRTLKDLIMLFDQLHADGIDLRSVHDQIDTTTPMGKFIFHLTGALAEFERGMTAFRTKRGMEAAKARGGTFGPRAKMTPKQVQKAIVMLKSGRGPVQVAKHFKVSRVTIYKEVLKVTKGKKLWRDGPLARKR